MTAAVTRTAETFAEEILKGMVGGQADMIEDTALSLARQRAAQTV